MPIERSDQLRQQALRAFTRDLPQLWAERPGQFVAYRGERLLGFAHQKHELYQQCLQGGLKQDEFVVFCIVPQETEIVLGPDVLD
jgi:hypothetical protein